MDGRRADRKRTIEVAAGVLQSRGRYLIAQRRPGDHLGLAWEFPGGKREVGESWEACLRRELREELGVAVDVGGLLDAVTHRYVDRSVSLRFFRCVATEGDPAPLGCHALLWVEPHELAGFDFPPADAELVRWLASAGRAGAAERGPRPGVLVSFASEERRTTSAPGVSLEEAASRAGASLCFGCRTGCCGSCLVRVRSGAGALSPPSRAERDYFARNAAPPGSRLACQARVLEDVVVEHDPCPLLID